MPTPNRPLPIYRHHKPSGQASVRLNGRDFYLGKHNTPESREKYDRFISEWLARNRKPHHPLTTPPPPASSPHGAERRELQKPPAGSASEIIIAEVMERFLAYAEEW